MTIPTTFIINTITTNSTTLETAMKNIIPFRDHCRGGVDDACGPDKA